ncbi:MAG: exonuclease SbcCD subunit D, partial [Thermoguttaceae bacterium]|nr:exonuclease SbcCD subunit D [Thermoguttaceae bacterium]
MKFIHLSDLHLGLKLFNYDLIEEQRDALSQIVEQVKQERPDAVVVAGDVYDKSIPSADALELFDDFLNEINEASPNTRLMTISGNHDSATRLDQYRRFLSRMNVHMVGLPPQRPDERIEKVVVEDEYGVVNFYLLPFVKPTSVKEIGGGDEKGNNLAYEESLRRLLAREDIDPTERNVLVSHQFYYPSGQSPDSVERMESETYGISVGNVDAASSDLLNAFDYAALGHIHKPWSLGGDPC